MAFNSVSPAAAPAVNRLWQQWPGALGLASAALILALGADRDTVATVVTVAVVCYLAAAALARPWVAWAMIPVTSVVVTSGELLGLAPWVGPGVTALVLIVVGVLIRSSLPALTVETAGLLGYGGLAMLALVLDPTAGLVLVAATLIAHAVWDLVHHRRNAVVPRSLAEFCLLLDVPLGLAVLLALIWA